MPYSKTQLLWIGTRPQLSKVTVNDVALSTGSLGFSSVVSNLDVLFDGQLSMANHVTSVCKSCFFQLRQLCLIRSCLTTDAAKTLIHAFVNSLLVGVIRKLQGVQNAAARMITGTVEPVNSTTLHRSFENCTGFQSPSGYNTRSRCWSTNVCGA